MVALFSMGVCLTQDTRTEKKKKGHKGQEHHAPGFMSSTLKTGRTMRNPILILSSSPHHQVLDQFIFEMK